MSLILKSFFSVREDSKKMSDGGEEDLKDEDKEVVKKLGLKIKSYTDIQKFKLDK